MSVTGNSRELKQRRRRQHWRERQKSIRFIKQNDNFAHVLRFSVHFLAVVARLRRETALLDFTFSRGPEHQATIFFSFSSTSMQSFRIEINAMKFEAVWIVAQAP